MKYTNRKEHTLEIFKFVGILLTSLLLVAAVSGGKNNLHEVKKAELRDSIRAFQNELQLYKKNEKKLAVAWGYVMEAYKLSDDFEEKVDDKLDDIRKDLQKGEEPLESEQIELENNFNEIEEAINVQLRRLRDIERFIDDNNKDTLLIEDWITYQEDIFKLYLSEKRLRLYTVLDDKTRERMEKKAQEEEEERKLQAVRDENERENTERDLSQCDEKLNNATNTLKKYRGYYSDLKTYEQQLRSYTDRVIIVKNRIRGPRDKEDKKELEEIIGDYRTLESNLHTIVSEISKFSEN